jgi:tetratricopeptide (TPR) repeat protein
VVCSPNSARSKWVNEEIETFIAAGREKFIRLIIVDGEPHSPDPATECLPPALTREGAPEPLAADIRPECDGKEGAKLKVLAGILGVPYDELRQREAARRQKRLAAIALAASIGFVIRAGLTLFAFSSRAEAIEQRKLAEQRTITAERTVEFVKSMFELADPSEARGASITAREIVDRGVEKLDSKSLEGEPVVKAELGVTLADVYGSLGLYQKSDELIRRTFAIRHDQPATLARQTNALAESQYRLGEYEEALRTFSKAWNGAGTASPSLRSRILAGWGLTLIDVEKYDDADRILRRALAIDRARGEPGGNDVARDLEALGFNQFNAGNLEAAQPLILRALALRKKFEGPLSPSVSDNYNTLGSIAYMRHDLPAAERYFRGNLEVDYKVLGADHPDVATTMNNLGRVLLERRRFREAAPLLERAIVIGERERGEGHAYMAFAYSNLAIIRAQTGRSREAEALFQQAIATARANQHRTLGPSLADLAQVKCATGRAPEGLKLLDEAGKITAADYPDDPWRSAWVENIRGECLMRDGRAAGGKKAIATSSPIIIKSWPAGTLFAVEAQRRAKLAA